MWTLLNPPPDRSPAQRYPHYLQVIGRLKPGVTLAVARDDIAAVADTIAREMPGTNKGHVATASPLRDRIIRRELRGSRVPAHRRSRTRAPHVLHQRRQPSARPRLRPVAGVCDTLMPSAPGGRGCPASPDGKPRPCDVGRSDRGGRRRGDLEGRALIHTSRSDSERGNGRL